MAAKISEKAEQHKLGASLHGLTCFFFCPGYIPLHCLTGRYDFSTQRASGEMNCPSQFFQVHCEIGKCDGNGAVLKITFVVGVVQEYPDEMASASSIVDGPVKESSWV